MGTLSWDIETQGKVKEIASSEDIDSGSASTSTSEGAVSGFVPTVGQIVTLCADEAMWVRFGGRTAAVGTGKFLAAGVPRSWEITQGDSNKAVSAIDVA